MVLVLGIATRNHTKQNFTPGQSYGVQPEHCQWSPIYSGVVHKSLEKQGLQNLLCSQPVKDRSLFPFPRYENWLFSLQFHLVVPSKIPKHWTKVLPLYKTEINPVKR